jgi:hypothetical protein
LENITRESVLAEVRDQLLRSVRSPEQRDVVSRWFAANESLVLLAIANALDILNFRAVQRAAQREAAKERPPRPPLPNEATYSFVDELGKEITLNSDDPEGELIEKLRQWMTLEPGQSSVWTAELEDGTAQTRMSRERRSFRQCALSRSGTSMPTSGTAKGRRNGPLPSIRCTRNCGNSTTSTRTRAMPTCSAWSRRSWARSCAQTPDPRQGRLWAAGGARCVRSELEHARQAAGWDYRPAIEAAAYDSLHARYQRKLTTREKWLTDKRRACLRSSAARPRVLRRFHEPLHLLGPWTPRSGGESVGLSALAQTTTSGAGLLSVVEPDTAQSVFLEAIAAEWPALKPFVCLEGEEDDPC